MFFQLIPIWQSHINWVALWVITQVEVITMPMTY